jgi:hypothetical protein
MFSSRLSGPDDPRAFRLDQLDRDDETARTTGHGTHGDVLHLEPLARLLRPDVPFAKREDGPFGDDEESAELGEARDDVVGQAARRLGRGRLAVRRPAQRHDGERGPPRRRRGGIDVDPRRSALRPRGSRRRSAGQHFRGMRHSLWSGLGRRLRGPWLVVCSRLDVADEAQALARDRADEGLRLAAVADGLTRRVDPASERRVRHDPPAPHRGDEVVLADDAVAVLDEVDEEVEHLRLDHDRLFAAAKLAAGGIEHVAGKSVNHVPLPERLTRQR